MEVKKVHKPLIENEQEIYNFWIKNNYFEPSNTSKQKKFSVALPPPNVTGHLHAGHAWDTTIQDCIARYKRLMGYNVCWFSGTDHAGISAQAKFEEILRKQGVERKTMSDKEFLTQLFSWTKSQSEYIHKQWGKLGLSLSYKSETFTLDKNVNDLIHKEFIKLYNDKLIYRANKLVNWDCKLQTSISDLEVIPKPVEQKMYYFKYKIFNSKLDDLIVATTRPETMFTDVALVINPNNKKFSSYKNKFAINPINNEKLKIYFSDKIEEDFGTGVMKCTPAHDFFDYDIAKELKITKYESCINLDGKLSKYAKLKDADFSGMDRLVAREKIVAYLKKKKMFVKEEKHTSNVGFSERSNEVVEPLLSLQWFVKMKPIIEKFKKISQKNKYKIIPERFNKNLNNWINNPQDWCISRQLLWGHKIPAWYKGNEVYVGVKKPTGKGWKEEKDVLDTWFSSGLWPLAVSKYNNKNKIYPSFYPIDLIVTGWDILTFWVARMYFQCCYIDNSISIKNVFVHGLLRAEDGRKMTKSLNNGIDPMDIVDKYGVDPMRIGMLSRTVSGEDMNYSTQSIEYAWSFLNKIINASNLIKKDESKINFTSLNFINAWIVEKFNECTKTVSMNLDKFNFVDAYSSLLNFAWNDFANVYLELIKNIKQIDKNTDAILSIMYKNILIMLHPFAPFISEVLYLKLFKNKSSIIQELWPSKILIKNPNIILAEYCIKIWKLIKDYRIKNNIKNSELIEINIISNKNALNTKLLEEILIKFNIKINNILSKPISTHIFTSDFLTIEILVSKKVEDLDKEKNKQLLIKLESEIKRSKEILSNANFINKAPKEKIDNEKNKLSEYEAQYKMIKEKI